MVHICKRCKRANPREAIFCYHDGGLLGDRGGGDVPGDGGAINLGTKPFTVPCVLPSGQACHNFQQLAEACHQTPSAALDLLRAGSPRVVLRRAGTHRPGQRRQCRRQGRRQGTRP